MAESHQETLSSSSSNNKSNSNDNEQAIHLSATSEFPELVYNQPHEVHFIIK
jgi:hypothetical protein